MGTWYAGQGRSGREDKSPSVRDRGPPGDEEPKLMVPEGPG